MSAKFLLNTVCGGSSLVYSNIPPYPQIRQRHSLRVAAAPVSSLANFFRPADSMFRPLDTIIRNDPFFAPAASLLPPLQITETMDGMKFALDLPGLKKDGIKVFIDKDQCLCIEGTGDIIPLILGERKDESIEQEGEVQVQERSFG